MFYEIKLEPPNKNILDLCYLLAKNIPIQHNAIKWSKDVIQQKLNVVSGTFLLNNELDNLIQKQYKNQINLPFVTTLGILENIENHHSGLYPPHTDRQRKTAINYYIDLGGDKVSTILYNQPTHEIIHSGTVIPYTELVPYKEIIFNKHKWYCFDTTQIHSVENIQTKRIFLSLSFISNFTSIKQKLNLVECQ